MITIEKYCEWFKKNENLTIKKDGNGYDVNGFFILPEKVMKARKSIIRTVLEEVTEWAVYATEYTPATQFEPEEYDEVEVAREPDFGKALLRVVILEKENDLSNRLRDWEEEEEIMEMK